MKEWWKRHLELLIECGLEKSIVEDIISKKKLRLREGGEYFFNLLSNKNVPLLILSAGVGDLISTFLSQQGLLTDNVHIISNFFMFNDTGKAIGVKHPIVSTANKAESEAMDSPYADQIQERGSVILLADKIEDLQMSYGIPHKTILKIGFLNEQEDQSRQLFRKQFDIVLEGDGSLYPLNEMLREILV